MENDRADDLKPGLHHYVNEEQVEYFKNRTLEEIFRMNEEFAKFVWMCQTKEERDWMRILKGKMPHGR